MLSKLGAGGAGDMAALANERVRLAYRELTGGELAVPGECVQTDTGAL